MNKVVEDYNCSKSFKAPAVIKSGNRGPINELWKNKWYYLMTLPGVLFFIVFCYFPMPGIVLAFKNYNFADGIFGSEWVGLKNFEFFFKSDYAWRTTFNTLLINFNYIVFGTIVAVFFALLLNEIRITVLKQLYQSLMFLPYFFSAIVTGNFVYLLFSTKYGIMNHFFDLIGLQPADWYSNAKYWVPILVGVYLWKNTGYAVILYLATIVGIDDDLYEASMLDGAGKLQQIRYITLPLLVPTIIIITLLAVGRMFYGDFQNIYAIIGDNTKLLATTDIIDTYVFRAVKSMGEISMPAAVGLYQSVCGFILVLTSNLLVKKYNSSYSLF